jgi:hypothetical protein
MGSEWILVRLTGGVDWILLAQDRNRWRAVVKAVTNLRVLALLELLLEMVKMPFIQYDFVPDKPVRLTNRKLRMFDISVG